HDPIAGRLSRRHRHDCVSWRVYSDVQSAVPRGEQVIRSDQAEGRIYPLRMTHWRPWRIARMRGGLAARSVVLVVLLVVATAAGVGAAAPPTIAGQAERPADERLAGR